MADERMARAGSPYDAILFDLLSALIDSWSLWDDIAGSRDAGRRWRLRYLQVTYATGVYRPYEDLLIESAETAGIGGRAGESLIERWEELRPWPEASAVLNELALRLPLGVVTNCSIALGTRAAESVEAPFRRVITAEEVGAYKPHPTAYQSAIDALGTTAARTLFVAGSPGDIGGATAAGMPVVWHDRVGLERPADGPEPRSIVTRLDSLLNLVG